MCGDELTMNVELSTFTTSCTDVILGEVYSDTRVPTLPCQIGWRIMIHYLTLWSTRVTRPIFWFGLYPLVWLYAPPPYSAWKEDTTPQKTW